MKILKTRVLYIYYFICLFIAIFIRYLYMVNKGEDSRIILFFVFIAITWIPSIVIFEKMNKSLVSEIKKMDASKIVDITLFGRGEILNYRGMFQYLFNNEDIENSAIREKKNNTKRALVFVLFQFGMFFPIGIIIAANY